MAFCYISDSLVDRMQHGSTVVGSAVQKMYSVFGETVKPLYLCAAK